MSKELFIAAIERKAEQLADEGKYSEERIERWLYGDESALPIDYYETFTGHMADLIDAARDRKKYER